MGVRPVGSARTRSGRRAAKVATSSATARATASAPSRTLVFKLELPEVDEPDPRALDGLAHGGVRQDVQLVGPRLRVSAGGPQLRVDDRGMAHQLARAHGQVLDDPDEVVERRALGVEVLDEVVGSRHALTLELLRHRRAPAAYAQPRLPGPGEDRVED